jgi:hypothetical protein
MRAFPFSLALFVALVGSASADTRQHEKEELARFQQFAGAPIDEFRMVDVFRTQVVGPENVVIWSTIKDAYLVKVDQPCRQLEWSTGFGVSQAQKWKVSRKFDFVDVGTRCRIVEIRPIDLAAMQKAARENSKSS